MNNGKYELVLTLVLYSLSLVQYQCQNSFIFSSIHSITLYYYIPICLSHLISIGADSAIYLRIAQLACICTVVHFTSCFNAAIHVVRGDETNFWVLRPIEYVGQHCGQKTYNLISQYCDSNPYHRSS